MLWKIGCATILVGIALGVGSFAFFGKAVREASDARQVASLDLRPGEDQVLRATADPDVHGRLRLSCRVELTEETVAASSEHGEILRVRASVNYQVLDREGSSVHRGAGDLSGSVIVPERSSPHYERFDPEVELTHESAPFAIPADGLLDILVSLPETDEDGNPVVWGEAEVYDHVSTGVAGWATGGVVAMLLGPLVGGIGVILFGIGVIVALSRRDRSGSTAA